jgi:hypothetical protein
VLAGSGGVNGDVTVEGVRREDADDVDVIALQEPVIVGVGVDAKLRADRPSPKFRPTTPKPTRPSFVGISPPHRHRGCRLAYDHPHGTFSQHRAAFW